MWQGEQGTLGNPTKSISGPAPLIPWSSLQLSTRTRLHSFAPSLSLLALTTTKTHSRSQSEKAPKGGSETLWGVREAPKLQRTATKTDNDKRNQTRLESRRSVCRPMMHLTSGPAAGREQGTRAARDSKSGATDQPQIGQEKKRGDRRDEWRSAPTKALHEPITNNAHCSGGNLQTHLG